MSLLAGIKNMLGANNARKAGSHKPDLVTAAETHILWRARLGHHIRGTIPESLNAAPLGQDGICLLGSWIRGSVLKPFCEPDMHQQLKEAHQNFHHSGNLIIERLKAGDRAGAEALFHDEYTPSLRGIIIALTAINKQLHNAQARN